MEELEPGTVASDGDELAQAASYAANPGRTIIDHLRQRRAELERERNDGSRHIDIEIPGYDGELVVRFVPVEWEYLKGLATRVDKSKHPRKELLACVDTLIKACHSIYAKVNGELESIGGPGEEPVQFDDRLADTLGIADAGNAREVLLKVFNNDLAVTATHNEVTEWMQSNRSEADEELLGE